MTCIAGMARNGEVWIGGDSCIVRHQTIIEAAEPPKVFRKKYYIVGSSGLRRLGQVVRYELAFPDLSSENLTPEDIDERMIVDFGESLRKLVRARGIGTEVNLQDDSESQLLVGVRGLLYHVCSGYSVTRLAAFGAIGCGADFALGSFHTTASIDADLTIKFRPRDYIQFALESAARFSDSVRPPYTILSSKVD